MNTHRLVEVSELTGSYQVVVQPDISVIVVHGCVTVAVELGLALVIWRVTKLIEVCKQSSD